MRAEWRCSRIVSSVLPVVVVVVVVALGWGFKYVLISKVLYIRMRDNDANICLKNYEDVILIFSITKYILAP